MVVQRYTPGTLVLAIQSIVTNYKSIISCKWPYLLSTTLSLSLYTTNYTNPRSYVSFTFTPSMSFKLTILYPTFCAIINHLISPKPLSSDGHFLPVVGSSWILMVVQYMGVTLMVALLEMMLVHGFTGLRVRYRAWELVVLWQRYGAFTKVSCWLKILVYLQNFILMDMFGKKHKIKFEI